MSEESRLERIKDKHGKARAGWYTFAQRVEYQLIVLSLEYLQSRRYKNESRRRKDIVLTRRSQRALNEAFSIALYAAPIFFLSMKWPKGGMSPYNGLKRTSKAAFFGALVSGFALMPRLTSVELLTIAMFGLSSQAVAMVVFASIAAADLCYSDVEERHYVWALLFLAVQSGTTAGAVFEGLAPHFSDWLLPIGHWGVAFILFFFPVYDEEGSDFFIHSTTTKHTEKESTTTRDSSFAEGSFDEDSVFHQRNDRQKPFSQVREVARVLLDASLTRKFSCLAPILSFSMACIGLALSLVGWSDRMIGVGSCLSLSLATLGFIAFCAGQAGYLEASKHKHGGTQSDRSVDNAKDVCLLCPFIGLTMLLATAYSVTSFLFETQCSRFSIDYGLLLKNMDTLFTLVFLPVLHFFVYPFLEKRQATPLRPVPKCVVSGFLFVLALLCALGLSFLRQDSVLIAVPQHFLLGLAVAVSGPTFYEVFYAEVPTQLRVVALATNFFGTLVGNLLGPNLVTVVYPRIYYASNDTSQHLSRGAERLSLLAAAGTLSLGLSFWWKLGASRYIYRQDRDWVTLRAAPGRARPTLSSSGGTLPRPPTTILSPTHTTERLLATPEISEHQPAEIVAVVRSIFTGLEANYLIPFSLLKMGKVVASGGSGQVYRGTYAGTPVAIKMVYSQMMDPQYLHEVRHEARMLAAVRHPHITQFHGISRFENRLLLVTEYIPVTLEQLLKEEKRPHAFSVLDALRIWIELAQTLIYLHSIGLGHRDLKPSNTLLAEQEKIYHLKLCDLGMARFLSTHADDAPGLGTPAYSPPESYSSTSTDAAKWDIFSFATLIWATWHHSNDPFPGLLLHQVSTAVARGDRPLFVPGAPPQILSLVQSMWAQDFNQRPSAQHVLSVLQSNEFTTAVTAFHQLINSSSATSSPRPGGRSSSSFTGSGRMHRGLFSSSLLPPPAAAAAISGSTTTLHTSGSHHPHSRPRMSSVSNQTPLLDSSQASSSTASSFLGGQPPPTSSYTLQRAGSGGSGGDLDAVPEDLPPLIHSSLT